MSEFFQLALTSPTSSVLIILGFLLAPTVIFEEYFGIKPRKEVRWTVGVLGIFLILIGLGMKLLLAKPEKVPSESGTSLTNQAPLQISPGEADGHESKEFSPNSQPAKPSVPPEMKAPAQPKPILQTTNPVIESDSYRFDLAGCYLEGSSVTCKLKVTNLAADRHLSCQTDYMTMWDNNGFEYEGYGVRLGEFSGYGSTTVSKQLISGIPIQLELDFKGWRPEGEFISVLKMDCQETEVQFRSASGSS